LEKRLLFTLWEDKELAMTMSKSQKRLGLFLLSLAALLYALLALLANRAGAEEVTWEHRKAWTAMTPDYDIGRIQFWSSGDVMIVSDSGPSYVLFADEDITLKCRRQLKRRFDGALLMFTFSPENGLVEPHFPDHEDGVDFDLILERCE
jgi:hypothetical protein